MDKVAEKALLDWRPINERLLLTPDFDSKYSKLSIIQCYAPTNDAEEEEKENFYNELHAVTSTIPRRIYRFKCYKLKCPNKYPK